MYAKSALRAVQSNSNENSRAEYEYERRVLIGEMNAWGKWMERHWEFDGYPGINILASYVGGDGGGSPGHRILCLEMPTGVFATNQQVLRLPINEQRAVWIRHVTVLKEDGSIYTIAERCRIANISDDLLRKRLSRAYQRIMGITPL